MKVTREKVEQYVEERLRNNQPLIKSYIIGDYSALRSDVSDISFVYDNKKMIDEILKEMRIERMTKMFEDWQKKLLGLNIPFLCVLHEI